ncbi:MAG: hypothetical protein ABI767_13860 [Rhodanobacter sp.]
MNRIRRMVFTPLLVASGMALSGCIVAGPRPLHHRAYARTVSVAPVRVWVPGYWGPSRVWVAGRWRDR